MLLFINAIIIQGCRIDDNMSFNDNQANTTNPTVHTEGLMILGDQLENPYSVKNMQKAYDSLRILNPDLKSDLIIEATHYYVRFLPKNFEELDFLGLDTTLILFDYPLDRIIENGGTYYHDPSLPVDQITWQYTSVPKNFTFSKVQYEILEELFLSQDTTIILKSSLVNQITYNQLEDLSLKMTHNYHESNWNNSGLKASWWTPSGTISVQDNDLGIIPIVGAKVRVRNWFKVKEALTNEQGYFQTESFKHSVDYSIKWERADFDIRSGNWGQAYFQGPNESHSAWNLLIVNNGMSFVYANVHRGAERYWYHNIYGIKTPPKNSFWSRKVKIGCFDEADRAFISVALRWVTFPEICIYRYNFGGTERSGRDLFRTSTHELAHSSHWDLSSWHYRNAEDKVVESWAVGVAYRITNDVYHGIEYNWQQTDLNAMRTTFENKYTPLVIDLIDDFNQNSTLILNCPCGTYDGSNCYVGTAPSGSTAFIYNNNFYYTAINGNQCPLAGSSYDGANCFLMTIPSNTTGFIYNNSWYAQEQGLPIDRVSGYTMGQIENAIGNVTTLQGWRDNIRNQNANNTENFLNELFNNFINL